MKYNLILLFAFLTADNLSLEGKAFATLSSSSQGPQINAGISGSCTFNLGENCQLSTGLKLDQDRRLKVISPEISYSQDLIKDGNHVLSMLGSVSMESIAISLNLRFLDNPILSVILFIVIVIFVLFKNEIESKIKASFGLNGGKIDASAFIPLSLDKSVGVCLNTDTTGKASIGLAASQSLVK